MPRDARRLGGSCSPAWAPYDVCAHSETGLFVELLLVGALVFALALTPLMRSIWRVPAAPAREDGIAAGDPAPQESDVDVRDLRTPLVHVRSSGAHSTEVSLPLL